MKLLKIAIMALFFAGSVHASTSMDTALVDSLQKQTQCSEPMNKDKSPLSAHKKTECKKQLLLNKPILDKEDKAAKLTQSDFDEIFEVATNKNADGYVRLCRIFCCPWCRVP